MIVEAMGIAVANDGKDRGKRVRAAMEAAHRSAARRGVNDPEAVREDVQAAYQAEREAFVQQQRKSELRRKLKLEREAAYPNEARIAFLAGKLAEIASQ